MIHAADLTLAIEYVISIGGSLSLVFLGAGLAYKVLEPNERMRNNWYTVAIATMFVTLLIVFVLNTIAVNIR